MSSNQNISSLLPPVNIAVPSTEFQHINVDTAGPSSIAVKPINPTSPITWKSKKGKCSGDCHVTNEHIFHVAVAVQAVAHQAP